MLDYQVSKKMCGFLEEMAQSLFQYLGRPEFEYGLESLNYLGEFLSNLVYCDIKNMLEEIKEEKREKATNKKSKIETHEMKIENSFESLNKSDDLELPEAK